MVTLTITLDPVVAAFYERVAARAQLPLENVLADALYKLAGELSLEAMREKERKGNCFLPQKLI